MTLNHQVFHAEQFLNVDVNGAFDLEQSCQILSQLVEDSSLPNSYNILFDLSDSACELNELDVYKISQFVIGNNETFSGRIAIFIDDEAAIDQSRFFKLCADSETVSIQLFFDFELAQAWLTKVVTESI